ncbi:tetratricopeptide repeat-containing protein [Cardiosporidium cionae]|uniref:Tetratricopeptide repeat-containing protein n=1 Tax=Cardiosporidium cionae TaxID=476202 RepID=A0ABQ7JBC2_9APIC|nr:tetratricopeptide repeat-containing protein [Cardiosporidium cionae]|eukprot:KAF8821289.1 tetratricopeptide repeat-containing protein [Cardiosporidium cionae]
MQHRFKAIFDGKMIVQQKIPKMITSRRALDFATLFLEDEKKKQQEPAPSPPLDFATESEQPSDNQDWKSKSVGDINYRKWENLERLLSREELEEEERLKSESAARSKLYSRCAHDHSKERQIFEKSTLEKLKAAERFQAEGNGYYAEKHFGLAAVNYRKALLQLDYCFPESATDIGRFNKIRLQCLLNLAACKLQQKDMEEVINLCSQALEIDASNCKGYYRMGLAYLEKDNYTKAEKYLMDALAIQPNCGSIHVALSTLKHKVALYSKRSVSVYRGMLRSVEDETSCNESLNKNTNTLSSSCNENTEKAVPEKSDTSCIEHSATGLKNVPVKTELLNEDKICLKIEKESCTSVPQESYEYEICTSDVKAGTGTHGLAAKDPRNTGCYEYVSNNNACVPHSISTACDTDIVAQDIPPCMNSQGDLSLIADLPRQSSQPKASQYLNRMNNGESCEEAKKYPVSSEPFSSEF